jgi:hypothetical protein
MDWKWFGILTQYTRLDCSNQTDEEISSKQEEESLGITWFNDDVTGYAQELIDYAV